MRRPLAKSTLRIKSGAFLLVWEIAKKRPQGSLKGLSSLKVITRARMSKVLGSLEN